METDRYIKRVEHFYDRYVDFYNNEYSKLKAFSYLSNIYNGLEKIRIQNKNEIDNYFDTAIEMFLIEWVMKKTENTDLTFKEAYPITQEFDSTFFKDYLNESIDIYGVKSRSEIKSKMLKVFRDFFDYPENGQFINNINLALDELEKLQKSTPNFHAIASLNSKIILKEYPERVDNFLELPSNEQDILSKVGRPFKKDLPQSEIESFVRKKLFPDGLMTNNKRFVHETGKHEGKPNWEQLSKTYLSEHPEIEDEEIITKRRLKDRVKMAYEKIIKSMK